MTCPSQACGNLRVPDNITLLHLPPYSPELNPGENVWGFLRGNKLSNRVFASYNWDDMVQTPVRRRGAVILGVGYDR